jgi:hypothetical protein
MAIIIIPIETHERYHVNDKEVHKDMNGNWIAIQELTTQERMAFNNYKKAVIENPAFKKHPRAEYKG